MAEGASEEIEPSSGRRKSHVIDEQRGINMTFDYLDMMESLQLSLDIPTVEKLCEYFNMTSSLKKIRASNNPKQYFLFECRREGIFTRNDTTKLLEAFRENGLSNLQSIIEDFNHISKFPDIHVTVNNDNPTSAFSNFKTFLLSNKRAIKSVLTRDRGIHFVDCKEGSLVISLKVYSVEILDKLKENIESGVLLRRLMATYESEISVTERKDFQSESSSMKLSYDTEEFENAMQQLTTNNFPQLLFFWESATSKETQTRTETPTLQKETERDLDPPCVSQSSSEEVTDEPRGIETTFDYLDMIDNLQFSLNTSNVEKLCKYFKMTSSLDKIRASDNPQHQFLLECRRKCIITRKDTTKLLEALRETGLTNLQSIIEEYNHILKCPDVCVTVNTDNPTSAFSNFKTFLLSQKRAIKSVITRDKGIHFVDCREGSLVIWLKVSIVEALDKLKEHMSSGKLLRRIMAMYENEISDTERKDFQSESSSIKLSYDTEELENAEQQLTTNNDEEDSDERDSEEYFLEYLDEVGLKEYFPRKLTMKKATEIRLFPSDVSQIKTKDLPFLFISKLTSLDCRVTWKENLHIDGSVRDFIYAIIHCSDNHLRQHLLEKFASCQLAVPVLLPGVRDDAKPELLTWALSRVLKRWKENETSVAPEKLMVSEPVFTTAFIRFGDIPISKSSVLNNVIGRAQGNGEFRYFLSYEEERENVYHCRGSVEAQWYLPMYGRKKDLLKEVTLLLNLRGDSKEFTTESEFMCSIANAIFIFVDKHNLEYYKKEIDDIKERFKTVFVVNVFSPKEKQGRLRRKQQLNTGKTLNINENDDSVDFGLERNVTKLAKIICERIVQYCNNTSQEDYRSIEDWQAYCFNDVTVDQDNDSYHMAKQLIQSSFPKHESIEEMKNSYLQLQVEWSKWVEADKKCLCVGEQTVANQFEEKENTKRDLRRIQRQKGLSAKMTVFLESLQTVMCHEKDLLHYFMSFFQTQIEMMVAREIPPLVTRIEVLNTSLKKLKSAMKQALPSELIQLRNEITELQKQLLNESEQVNAKTISCEHFIRELGHWYEANIEDENVRERNELLVSMASKLLLAGYPLEVLDGENAYIPIKWISGVLKNLENILNNPKMFVLSVIGIQSSGKSTLLNSMFGAKFPVRAVRCTRGLYLQLLEVNVSFHEQLGFEYLLIIDTEGLQSPDRTVLNDYKFDNSIATLAMCIGDLSLLNIGQETIGPDMFGILQIVVHALIRMTKVELVSNCRIIQQRVSDIYAAAVNNKTNMVKIKDALNKVTRIAAAEEKVDHIKDFSDVFTFAEEDDLQFFPCLWMGLMFPPNPGYSDKIHALKDAIFKPKLDQPVIPPQFTMAKFVRRLQDVWDAVKSEDFVFNFQNSVDAISNQRFRLEHSKLIGKMRTEIFQWELNNGRNITNATKRDFYRKLEIEITNICESINKKIDEYVNEHSDEEEVKRRQESIKNETIGISKEIERSIKENTMIQLQNEADIKGLPTFIIRAIEELKFAAKEAANQIKRAKHTSNWNENHEELDRQFDVLWDKKIKQLETEFQNSKITEADIEEACDNSLKKLLLGTKHSKAYTDGMRRNFNNNKRSSSWEMNKVVVNKFGEHYSASKDVVFGIVNRHKNDLYSHAKLKPFQHIRVDTILQEVYIALTQSNVNSGYVVRTLCEVQNEICTVCKDCQLKYDSHNSLQRLFESEKECLLDDYKGFVDEIIKSEAAVQRTYSECVTVLRNVTLDDFNVKLLKQMRNYDCYNDKQRMLGRILEDLCLKKDPKLYYDFIQDNDTFVSNWLNQKVLTEITKRSQYWVTDIIDTKLNELLGYVQSALRKTGHQLMARGGEQTTTFREWANTFLKNEYISTYGRDIHFSAEDFNISNIEEFTKMLESMFSSHLKTDITKGWDLDKLSDPSVASRLHSQIRNVTRDILDHLGTCKEVCPFCKVPCHLQLRGEHYHTAIFHYSLGLAGVSNNKSQKLISEPCTVLVASDNSYRCKVGPPEEFRPYKEYTKDYPSWYIPPVTGDASIIYWMWVLQTFNNDFAKLYNAKPATLTKEWRTVSQEDALKSLRVEYHLTEQ